VRSTIALFALLVARVASAQPSLTQPMWPPPPPQLVLSEDDRELLARGEIDGTQTALGVGGAVFIGLGVGQAIEGRWSDTGWIFTFGEPAAMVVAVVGLASSFSCDGGPNQSHCGNQHSAEALAIGGLIGLVGLRVWEIGDSYFGPMRRNDRVRDLRLRLGYGLPPMVRLTPFAAPVRDGAVAGLSLRF